MSFATPASEETDDVLGYISDMLARLADLAGDTGSDQLERSLRLLALEVAADEAAAPRVARPGRRN